MKNDSAGTGFGLREKDIDELKLNIKKQYSKHYELDIRVI